MDAGRTVGFILGTTTTGMLGSVTTRFYRKTVVQYIGTTLESVITGIRKNSHFTSHNRVFFEVGDNFRFEGVEAKENRRMFFDFSFKVVPLPGTPPRPLDQSVPAPNLPNYELDSTCSFEFGTNKHLLDGISGAVVEGAVFGLVGGAVARAFPVLKGPTLIETVPGEVNVIHSTKSTAWYTVPSRMGWVWNST
ncbi:hypothetical protein F5883DRAFT_584719 [Diaporthe sp. PMI_573]|nr:hypothetical protein F5883DRAFT_584719 [Diaporthaceae sp. PMI_573]